MHIRIKNIFFLLIALCITQAAMLCFKRRMPVQSKPQQIQSSSQKQTKDIEVQPVQSNSSHKQIKIQSQTFRSHHPHYINSFSYPRPFTPHFYYGEVKDNLPVFLLRDMDRWNPNSISKLVINGIQYTDASAKYYLLRRQQQLRYMLVMQMENSFQNQRPYSIQVLKRKEHYLLICHYDTYVSLFRIYLTHKGKPMPLTTDGLRGINLYLRNQSEHSGRQNWRFSQRVRWLGRNNVPDYQKNQQFVGFVLEIEYFDRNLLKEVVLNLEEEPYTPQVDLDLQILQQQHKDFSRTVPDATIVRNKYETCAKAASQKILDGLTYQFGRLKIKNGDQWIKNQPAQLLSFSPSRKRFPWGFLWDDGFHCEVAVRDHPELTIRVIKSWLDTMLENGWIPRQQNRGMERQELCNCPRFMVKDIRDGNPPTLIVSLQYLRKQNKLNTDSFPLKYWQKLKKWYQWFIQTQKDDQGYFFKWHDSINQMGASFTSGMDDFPRPVYSKAHIDLQSWMYLFTKFMAEISHIYNESPIQYIRTLQLIKKNFKFFIQPSTNLYKDIANDTSSSPDFGYPSILPIAFGVPQYNSPQYNATIQAVKNHLDTGHGLSSISKYSSHYLQNDDAYWKGPVWININYLFLRGLKLYYPQQVELYRKLREDLIRVVCGAWQKSGYFYENYTDGRGTCSFPFNGWTSLIALIIQEQY